MPLLNSGAALFAGGVEEFVRMAPASTLTIHLQQAFNARWERVSEAEVESWRHSLTALARVVETAGVQRAGVGVEVKLPLTDRRIDASFVARDGTGRPHVVLVELKQWESAGPSLNPDSVLMGGREHLHPSVQAGAYDYCGVILGNDFVWRNGVGWVATRDASKDPAVLRRKLDPPTLKTLLRHT